MSPNGSTGRGSTTSTATESAGSTPALETYLVGLGPELAALVRALDSELQAAAASEGARFDVAIKYQILMYAIDRGWRHWVCALDAGRRGPDGLLTGTGPSKGVALRFHYGVLLDDPLRLLRPGSSILMTWDIPRNGPVDVEGVRRYVAEAVRRYPECLATSDEILATNASAAAKVSAGSRRREGGGRAGQGSR